MDISQEVPDLTYPNFEALFKEHLEDFHTGEVTVDGLNFVKKYIPTEDEMVDLLHTKIVDPSQEPKADLGK